MPMRLHSPTAEHPGEGVRYEPEPTIVCSGSD